MFQQRSVIAMLLFMFIMLVVLYVTGRQPGYRPGLTACRVSGDPLRVVQIAGDVANPGMYCIDDILLTDGVINMVKPLCGQTGNGWRSSLTSLPVPGDSLLFSCKNKEKQPVITISRISSAQLLTLGLALDLNTVEASDLEMVPDIGPSLAKAIVDYRHNNGGFVSSEQLLEVEGIGDKKLMKLKKYFK